jgi:hypothetical protein
MGDPMPELHQRSQQSVHGYQPLPGTRPDRSLSQPIRQPSLLPRLPHRADLGDEIRDHRRRQAGDPTLSQHHRTTNTKIISGCATPTMDEVVRGFTVDPCSSSDSHNLT